MKGWGGSLAVQGLSKRYFKRYVLCEVGEGPDEKEIARALERTCRWLCGEAFYHLFSFSVVRRLDGYAVIRVKARAHDLGVALLVMSLTKVGNRFLLPVKTSGSIRALIKRGGAMGLDQRG